MERTIIGLVLAKAESTYGVDAVPTGGANTIAVSRSSVKFDDKSTHIIRQILDGSIGGVQGVNAQPTVNFSFSVEIRGNRTDGSTPDISAGASGNALEIDCLLQACDLAPSYTSESNAGVRDGFVTYKPTVPADQGKSVTIDFFTGLKRHKILGCKGTYKINLTAGKFGMIDFTLSGKHVGAVDSDLPSAGHTLTGVVITSGGTGYAVGDVLTFVTSASVRVTAVSGGVITAVTIVKTSVGAVPSNPVSPTGGTGTGASLTLTWATQTAAVWLNTKPPIFENSGSQVDSFAPVFTKIDFDAGLKVEKREDGNSVDGIAGFVITDRAPKCTIDPESVSETTSPIWDDLYNNTKRTIISKIGTQSGNSFQLTLVAVSEAVSYGDRSGIRTQQISYSVERQNIGDTPGSEVQLKFS